MAGRGGIAKHWIVEEEEILGINHIREEKENHFRVNAITMSEHWLEQNETINIQGYDMVSCFSRTSKKGGGSCILIESGVEHKELVDLKEHSVESIIECSAVILTKLFIIIINVYRPPQGDIEEFFVHLDSILQKLNTQYKSLFSGDFNIDLLSDNRHSNKLKDLFKCYNLTHAIEEPTRVTTTSQTLVDNVFTNAEGFCAEVLITTLSDHTAQMISFTHNTFENDHIPTKTSRRIFSNNTLQLLKFELEKESWQKVYQGSCVNESYVHFLNIIVAAMDKYARKKTINTHSFGDEWLTDNIRTLSKIKRQLYEEVDDYLVTCEYPSEIEIAAAVTKTQFNEMWESEEEEEEPESIFGPSTAQQVLSAIKTVSTYLEFNDFQSNLKQQFDFVQKGIEDSLLKKSATQKKITECMNFVNIMSLSSSIIPLILVGFVVAQYDPYGQRPYNQNTDRPNYSQYDRNNPNNPNNPNSPYDRPGQGLSDRERYDRFDRNRTDPYGQQNPYNRDRYGQGQSPYGRDRLDPYDYNRTNPYDRNAAGYNPYNRSDPYGQRPYDGDHRYGQAGQYDRNYPAGQGGRFGGQDDGTCCEDYCYERDREQQTKFATVTSYQFASGRHQVNQDVPQCKPILFWSINKHGTNIPDYEVLQRMKGLDRIREDVVRNYNDQLFPLRGRLCPEDYDLLSRWRLNESITYYQGKELTPEGKEELRMLARRFQNKYRDLLSVPYSETHYYFKYANVDKIYDSYQAYLEGLFNNNIFNVHAVVDPGDLSRGYRSCYGGSYSSSTNYDPYNQNNNDQRYTSGGYQSSDGYSSSSSSNYAGQGGSGYSSSGYNQGQYGSSGYSTSGYNTGQQSNFNQGGFGSSSSFNPNRDYEYNQFKRNPEYMDVAKNVLRRLGFVNYMPNETIIEDIYNMCRYEKAWFPTRPSAWCVAFNKKQLDVLEYAQDLRQYFANGYGNEDVSNRLGCGILKEMYQRLKRGVEGYTSDPRVAVTFATEGSIENLLVAMGMAKDYTPLNAQNYYSQTRRKWRTANLSPFAANLVAVLHE
ncbi:multiple inositol polyphosphate phosphatase-related [Holotrichia oblita]|uniref:Multiple inositol polyphosphate phosphatase-related n=1 Tax=Holotrichia oblita TaxID=644536 RepID=A0ACB9SP22_HOLOL|nr:multiple inositol polyphosphate phosphatase-related [Holotrichia oblita]